MTATLISPYGGRLVGLIESPDSLPELRAYAKTLSSLQISERSMCDLELLATGGFSPLDRFMTRRDFDGVRNGMRLEDETLFPIPIFLPVSGEVALREGTDVALRNSRNDIVAVMTIEEIYTWRPEELAGPVFGTADRRHPLVAEMDTWGARAISGPLRVLPLPRPHDFRELRHTPAEVRSLLEARGHANVVAFQTRNPMHRAHEELTLRAIEAVDGVLLLHPVVGMTKPGDVDHYTRVRTYKEIAAHYPAGRVVLSLLPLAMRMAGPREALWHAIIRRNYGANHFIVGRDHASPGPGFYGAYDAQQLVSLHAAEIGVKPVLFEEMLYLADEDRYEETSKVPQGASTRSLSGTQVRDDYLNRGVPLPVWFTRPGVAAILGESYPARHKQGFCVWLTGLSGAGKSATAEIVTTLLLEHGRQVTVLDGDVVRTHLSKGLGFSKEDRDANILRIGFVAAEIARHGGAVVCAAVSPYRATRDAVRTMVGGDRFIEVFVDAPLEVCESRDTKGMYAAARRGEIRNFTGIDDPYEPPLTPELAIDSDTVSAEQNARSIVEVFRARGFVR
ncbi:MAG: bifunctional sulfate adenylyltransferase/adenylylsulfate kinase [Thermoanaerobaculia bacterium]|nr:bifunctional sulfate adenylyltransferase/adenylylsulfate kinase [Thermoanaerobaculia bacterium]